MYNFEYNSGEAIGYEHGKEGVYQQTSSNPYKMGTKKYENFEKGYTDGFEQAQMEIDMDIMFDDCEG